MSNIMTLTTPLMRKTVGFDRFNDLFETLLNETNDSFEQYPPYNIEKHSDDSYRIVMAVAGFSMNDLNIMLEDGQLTVSGRIEAKDEGNESNDDVRILHRGIATRAFERKFRLADYMRVNGATLENGLLSIDLERIVPEEKKPRMIEIQSSEDGFMKKFSGKPKPKKTN